MRTPNSSVYWYESSISNLVLSRCTFYNTPILNSDKTYYVECKDAYTGCTTGRQPLQVTVLCPPAAPVISSNVVSVCTGDGVNLTATGCSATVNWSDGGTGPNRSNVIFNSSVTLTATCNNGLTSPNSNSITINVNPKPNLVITNPASVSAPNTVNITLASVTSGSTLPPGTSLSYFTDLAGTNLLTSPPASAVNVSGTYYIKANTPSNCSDIKPVIVLINDCGTALMLQSAIDDYNSGTTLKKTNETITARNKITGSAIVTFRSNKSITLEAGTSMSPGFKADVGTVFKAEIGGCN